MTEASLIKKIAYLEAKNSGLLAENQRLREMLNLQPELLSTIAEHAKESQIVMSPQFQELAINKHSTPDEKIELFMSLFQGRSDVYTKRWYNAKSEKAGYSPVCSNEWQQGVCNKPRVKCKSCPNRDFVPLSRETINRHLRNKDENGVGIIGVYPLFPDDTCLFLAVDFDDERWQEDISAFREICVRNLIPVAIERSRSGEGGHAWIFFEEAIPAIIARKLGSVILTSAMALRHQISFESYDRMFPNQDFMPKGGFGNLIALPLQNGARLHGNSEFVDEQFNSYTDQWAFLCSINKLVLPQVEHYISTLCKDGELGTLAQDLSEEIVKPWEKKKPDCRLNQLDFPQKVNIVFANMLYVEKNGISQRGLNRIKRLAAFSNPDFYKTQAMRLSTHNKPRIIFTLDETPEFLGVPRGCKNALIALLNESGITCEIDDKRNSGNLIDVEFTGMLRDEQDIASKSILAHDNGVLCATTAFGKTVIGAHLIARRKTNTLILVHTQALLSQWKKVLEQFLCIKELLPKQPEKRGRKKSVSVIGQLGAGKHTLNGIVDIAVMQSLFDGDDVKELVKGYGMVIVDECHHVSAFSFEKILKKTDAKFVYGLTATPNRQDGHHPIIFMQCGEIRYRVDAKAQAEKRSFEHYIIPCFTGFKKPVSQDEASWAMAQIYAALCDDELRNRQIANDIIAAIENNRTPIVLTERSAHVEKLAAMLYSHCKNVISLTGKASPKEKREAMERLTNVSKDEPLVIVATGKYVGEGFDFPRLDALFLAMPISWKGTIAQYAGRLHREYEGKQDVIIYDYVDVHVGVLERMYHKRVKSYAHIGYKAKPGQNPQEQTGLIYDTSSFAAIMETDFERAAKEIIIVSPFMRVSRVSQIMRWLPSAMLGNVMITVVTRPVESFKEKDKANANAAACVERLESAGIHVIQKPNIHQKFIIVDRKVVWYGSVNLLSYGNAEESIMRLESYELAAELEGILQNENI